MKVPLKSALALIVGWLLLLIANVEIGGSSDYFWLKLASVAAIFLFLVHVKTPLWDKIKVASWWSVIAPALLVGFAAYHERYSLLTSVTLYASIMVFFVCMDASLTLLLRSIFKKRND